jgi:hypothetical protein
MNKLTKVVNIYPSSPITTVNPPIRSAVKGVTKSIEEIRSCLMARATVEEILSDGSVVRLDNTNYNMEILVDAVESGEKESAYDKAFKEAIGDVDLAKLTRKERRKLISSAKDAANKAVSGLEVKEYLEVAQVDAAYEATTEDKVEVSEELNETENNEEQVETLDIEKLV